LKRARREFVPWAKLAAAGLAAAVLLACTTGSPRDRAARAPERENRIFFWFMS
jgi:hypothetical protein